MKAVKKVLPAQRPHWVGNGFHVFPVFAHYAFSNELSPWLMFDYAAPKHFEPTAKRLGVGQHPHRGFETVTIAWQGEVEHSDSVGNNDVIGAGDVQWMTAGRGATSRFRQPSVDVCISLGGACYVRHHPRGVPLHGLRAGGRHLRDGAASPHRPAFPSMAPPLHTRAGGPQAQLWINLPQTQKMHAPRYQPLLASRIPTVPLSEAGECSDVASSPAGKARVIAGTLDGTHRRDTAEIQPRCSRL